MIWGREMFDNKRRVSDSIRNRRGLTLIEVLVIVGIIAVALCLWFPAVEYSRESARRSQCQNQLKQLGLALHSYHDALTQFPPGTIWPRFQYDNPRTPFLPFLLPYLDQVTLYNQINWDVSDTLWCHGNNEAVVKTPVPQLLCPSDGIGGATKINPYCGTQATTNYMGFFGERIVDAVLHVSVFTANRGTQIDEITDGLSNTMMMGEYLTGTPKDLRGQMWGDEAGASLLFCQLRPNSPSPDLLYPNPKIWDPANPEINAPSRNLPCGAGDGFTTDTVASRSRHRGGVYVLMADGSVRFVSDAVNLATWRTLGIVLRMTSESSILNRVTEPAPSETPPTRKFPGRSTSRLEPSEASCVSIDF